MTGKRLVPVYLGYAVALLVFFSPIVFMVWSAFRDSIDISSSPFNLGSGLSLDNFEKVFSEFNFLRYTINSLLIAGASTLIGLVIGAPAAYVVVRRKWRSLAFFMLVARMAPGIMFLLPIFVLSVSLGAPSNTALNYALLILAHVIVTLPLCVWLLVPYFEAVPESIEESAMVDGANVLRRFRQIALPLVAPGLAVSVILSFIFSWNYFLFALALANSDTIPLPAIAFSFIGEGQSDYGGLMAASTLISLPALILAVAAQKWLVRGLTGGAVK